VDMKKTKKLHSAGAVAGQGRVVNKDIVKKRIAHSSVVPRMEGVVKNARMLSKHKMTVKQIQKPKKSR
jgi:hypothetical protein